MSTSSVDSTILQSLVSSYVSSEDTETESTSSSDLGTEDFLTLLVAQLENQNPLDPADTSQFTDQLAQFSQLEQLINLNDKMDETLEAVTDFEEEVDASVFVGMQVTGTVDTMTVEDGSVSSGYYDLDEAADVYVLVYDEDGSLVTTLDEGQVDAGSYLISWDGTDSSGGAVDDATYTYVVMANSGSGYEEITSTITGTVDAVSYLNGKAYLVVGGLLLDPSSVTTVTDATETSSDSSSVSVLEYLGTTVSTYYPIVRVEDSTVSGDDLTFYLDAPEAVTITIYDANDEAVATIEVDADDTSAGDNSVHWDALADTGYAADDGLYYYTVETASGDSATTPTSGEVVAIQSVSGTQYLELDNGRLVSVSNVTSISK